MEISSPNVKLELINHTFENQEIIPRANKNLLLKPKKISNDKVVLGYDWANIFICAFRWDARNRLFLLRRLIQENFNVYSNSNILKLDDKLYKIDNSKKPVTFPFRLYTRKSDSKDYTLDVVDSKALFYKSGADNRFYNDNIKVEFDVAILEKILKKLSNPSGSHLIPEEDIDIYNYFLKPVEINNPENLIWGQFKYIDKMYYLSIFMSIKIIPIDSNSNPNYTIISKQYLPDIDTGYYDQNFFSNASNIFCFPVDITKHDIDVNFKSITPISESVVIKATEVTNTYQKVIDQLNKFFNEHKNINTIVLKYAFGSRGQGIYAISRDNLTDERFKEEIIKNEYVNNIIEYHQQKFNKPIDLVIIIQEYIVTHKCDLCPKTSTTSCDLYCSVSDQNSLDDKIQNLLSENEKIDIDKKNSFNSYQEVLKDDIRSFHGKSTTRVCVTQYNQKLRIFPIFRIHWADNDKMKVELYIPDIIAFEWLLPFKEEDVVKFFKDKDNYYYPGVKRYISNSIAGDSKSSKIDKGWWNHFWSVTLSNKSTYTKECFEKMFPKSVNDKTKEFNHFLEHFFYGFMKSISKNINAPLLEKIKEVIMVYSVDILIGQNLKYYVIDINNVGIPTNSKIVDFIFLLLLKEIEPGTNIENTGRVILDGSEIWSQNVKHPVLGTSSYITYMIQTPSYMIPTLKRKRLDDTKSTKKQKFFVYHKYRKYKQKYLALKNQKN